MVSDRPYRKGRSIGAARAEIEGLTGSQFDHAVVEAFLQVAELDLIQIRRRHAD
jgi:HD-GYP domain-containing protein (c-di-GMP phosphodiesterase class II)